MRVFAVAQSEEKRNAARIKGKKKVVGKKNLTEEFVIAKSGLQTQNVKF